LCSRSFRSWCKPGIWFDPGAGSIEITNFINS
jgi:hypothetical protein